MGLEFRNIEVRWKQGLSQPYAWMAMGNGNEDLFFFRVNWFDLAVDMTIFRHFTKVA